MGAPRGRIWTTPYNPLFMHLTRLQLETSFVQFSHVFGRLDPADHKFLYLCHRLQVVRHILVLLHIVKGLCCFHAFAEIDDTRLKEIGHAVVDEG